MCFIYSFSLYINLRVVFVFKLRTILHPDISPFVALQRRTILRLCVCTPRQMSLDGETFYYLLFISILDPGAEIGTLIQLVYVYETNRK